MAPPNAHKEHDLVAMRCRIVQMEVELRAVQNEAQRIQGGGTAILGLLDTQRQTGFIGNQPPLRDASELKQAVDQQLLTQDKTQLHLKTASLEAELRMASDHLKMAQAGTLYLVGLLANRAPAALHNQQAQLMLSHEIPISAHGSQHSMPSSHGIPKSLLDEDLELLRFEQMPASEVWGVHEAKASGGWEQPEQVPQEQTDAGADVRWGPRGPAALYGPCPVYHQTLAKSPSDGPVLAVYPPKPFWDGPVVEDGVTTDAVLIETSPKSTPEHFGEMAGCDEATLSHTVPASPLLLGSPFHMPFKKQSAPPHAPRGPLRRPYFTRTEHNLVRGIACFIEDMEEDEKEQKLIEFANIHRGHTLAQWKDYYAREIRQSYLEQELRRMTTMRAPETHSKTSDADTSASLDDGDESSVPPGLESDSSEGAVSGAVFDDKARSAASPAKDAQDEMQPQNIIPGVENPGDTIGCGLTSSTSTGNLVDLEEATAEAPPSASAQALLPPQAAGTNPAMPPATGSSAVLPLLHGDAEKLAECREMLQNFTKPTTKRGRPRDRVRREWKRDSTQEGSHATSSGTRPPYCLCYEALREITQDEFQWAKIWDPSFVNHVLFKYEDGDLSKNTDLRRTVLLQNIPPATLLVDVLDKVRTGKLICAKFVDTAVMRTIPPSGDTVLLEFQHARAACEFVKKTPQLALPSAGSAGNAGTATVSVMLVQTPTRPSSEYTAVERDACISRVVFLADHRKQLTPYEVMNRLWHVDGSLAEAMGTSIRADGVIILEYAAIADARKSLIAMKRLGELGNMDMGYAADPCESRHEQSGQKDGEVEGGSWVM